MSLRVRLTLSYALLVAVVLIAVALVLTRFAFDFLAAPTATAVARTVASTQAVIAAHPGESTEQLRERIRDAAAPGAVVVFPPPFAPRRLPRGGGSLSEQFSLRGLLGLRPHQVILPDGSDVLVAPNLANVEGVVGLYLEALGVAIVLALGLAWFVARWITAQAISPLITVTGELRRFAAGDFTRRSVSTNDRSEIGELSAAFNGATAQVAAAFAERAHVEAQMRRFVADAGHELRTPLTVISGFLEVLQKGGVDEPGIRDRAFATMRTETNRMRKLVERLVSLARLESPDFVDDPELLDVGEIASGAVAEVLAARPADVELNVAGETSRVLADRADLHEAIGNLVDNAVKYGGEGRVTVDVRDEGEHVVVRVHDQGPGVSERDREHLFERFFRGERASGVEGSGLGLAIVQRAVARCGGTVKLEPAARNGSTFSLVLPAHGVRGETLAPLRLG